MGVDMEVVVMERAGRHRDGGGDDRSDDRGDGGAVTEMETRLLKKLVVFDLGFSNIST